MARARGVGGRVAPRGRARFPPLAAEGRAGPRAPRVAVDGTRPPVFLVQPQKRGEETSWLRPRVAVLVDVSESMADKADRSQPTRAERVAAWLRSPSAREVAEKFDARWFVFDGTVSELAGLPVALRFEGKRSDPWGALARVTELCQGQPLAGILLFTDGLAGAGGNGGCRTGDAGGSFRNREAV